jgi:hypothetical protein
MKEKMKIMDVFSSKEPGTLDTVEWILRVTVVTLAMIMMAVIGTLMIGLFMKDVDNTEIFSIIGPAFNTIVGAFVGLLGGLSLNNINGKDKPLELTEPAPEPEPEPEGLPVVPYNEPAAPVAAPVEEVEDDDDDDDMAPWEKYRNDLRYDANGDGVVDEDDFPDWRSAGQ